MEFTASFDGSTKYLTVPDNDGIDVGTGNMTWSWWASINDNSANMVMFSKNANGTYPHYDSYVEDADGSIHVRLEFDASNRYDWKTTGTDYKDGVYRHFVFVTDRANNKPILYIDGVSVTLTAVDSIGDVLTGDISSSADLYIGRSDIGGTPLYFNGSIANFMIFQENLTSTDVTNLYNSATLKQVWEYTSVAIGGSGFSSSSSSRSSSSSSNSSNVSSSSSSSNSSSSNSSSSTLMAFTASFDGSTKYLTVPDSDNIDVGTGDMTWVWWASIEDKGSDMVMFDKNANGTYPHYDSYVEDADGSIHVSLEFDASNRYDWKTNNAVDYKDSTYRQFAWVSNRSGNQPILYIDGINISMISANSAGSVATGDISSSADLYIGRQDIGGTPLYFQGSIANFMIFQEELTLTEINELSGAIKQPWEYN